MGTQLRRLASYVGVAVLVVTGLVGGATASSAEAPAGRWSIAVNSGSCATPAPVVTVQLTWGDGKGTSLGYTSLDHPDQWVHHIVKDGTYKMTLPKVASGDTEQFLVSFEHDPLGAKKNAYSDPYSFSVPAECGGPKPFTARPIPTLTGTSQVGKTLTARSGTWAPTPDRLTYSWQRDGFQTIAGAASPTYTLTAADKGHRLRAIVTASKAGYVSSTRSSAYTDPIAAGTAAKGFVKAPFPRITGRPKVRRTLIAWAGTWSPAPSSVSYRWYRSGVLVRGVTGRTYRLTRPDVRKRIRVIVTASKSGYVTTARASLPTSRIKR